MSFRTLSSMVAAATQEAERHIKMASAADAIGTTDFDIQKLAEDGLPPEATDDKKKAKAKEEKDEKEGDKEKKSSIDYAFKLAEALRIAAPMVEKLAEQSPLDAPGPQVMASQQVGSQQLPKPPKAKTDPGKSGVGTTGTLETNAKDVKSVDWTKNKEASSAFVQAKLAQAELLAKLGHAEAADHILSKLAQDPSSPQPVLPPNSGPAGALQLMPDVPSGRVPESAQGIAAMTRASAKDPTTRTVTEHIQEAPKKDNMVAPTQMVTTGLKVSHVVSKLVERGKRAGTEKMAVSGYWIENRVAAATKNALRHGAGDPGKLTAAANRFADVGSHNAGVARKIGRFFEGENRSVPNHLLAFGPGTTTKRKQLADVANRAAQSLHHEAEVPLRAAREAESRARARDMLAQASSRRG